MRTLMTAAMTLAALAPAMEGTGTVASEGTTGATGTKVKPVKAAQDDGADLDAAQAKADEDMQHAEAEEEAARQRRHDAEMSEHVGGDGATVGTGMAAEAGGATGGTGAAPLVDSGQHVIGKDGTSTAGLEDGLKPVHHGSSDAAAARNVGGHPERGSMQTARMLADPNVRPGDPIARGDNEPIQKGYGSNTAGAPGVAVALGTGNNPNAAEEGKTAADYKPEVAPPAVKVETVPA